MDVRSPPARNARSHPKLEGRIVPQSCQRAQGPADILLDPCERINSCYFKSPSVSSSVQEPQQETNTLGDPPCGCAWGDGGSHSVPPSRCFWSDAMLYPGKVQPTREI